MKLNGYSIYYRGLYVGSVSAATKRRAIALGKREYGAKLGVDMNQVSAEKHSPNSAYASK
jgi:hypothetical protein